MKSFKIAAFAAPLALALMLLPAQAADHLDAPGLMPPGDNPALDITDVFAFQSPDCADCVVLAMGVNSLTPAGVQADFDRKAAYIFDIDTDGDAKEDITFVTRFGKVRKDGTQRFKVRRNEHPAPASVRKKVVRRGFTTPIGEELNIVNGRDGVKAFAGMVDDAFYFDLPAFINLDFCAEDPAADTFAGSNVTLLALEIPKALLVGEGADIGVWGATWKKGEQVDRMGRPGINTVLIPTNSINPDPSRKNEFNAGVPETDFANFSDSAMDSLMALGNDAETAAVFASVLLPDILTVNVDQPTNYLNGRSPVDDVIDASLNLLTGGAIPSDCVDTNDVPLSDDFPFFGLAHLE